MKIDTDALKKQVILHLPYLLFLLAFAKLGEAVRLAPGADTSQKLLGLSEGFSMAFQSMWPGAALLAKHIVSLYDMCFDGDTDYDISTWNEKITDSLNYLFLLKAIVKEGHTNQPN